MSNGNITQDTDAHDGYNAAEILEIVNLDEMRDWASITPQQWNEMSLDAQIDMATEFYDAGQ